MNTWMILIVVLIATVVLFALWAKGDVSASMSLWRILEFKLDAKEKHASPSKDPSE